MLKRNTVYELAMSSLSAKSRRLILSSGVHIRAGTGLISRDSAFYFRLTLLYTVSQYPLLS